MILVTMITMTTTMRNRITKITMITRIPPEAKAFQSFLNQEAFQKQINREVSLSHRNLKISLNQFNPKVFQISPNHEPSLSLPHTEAFLSHLNQQASQTVLGNKSSTKPQSQGAMISGHREAKCQHPSVPHQPSWRCNMTQSSLLLLTYLSLALR